MKKGISIIVPCYNAEKYLDKCINSIVKQMTIDYELILVDDCSKDKTWNVIKKYSNGKTIIGIKNDKNSGAGYSRNQAVKMAKYDYISFIDADDYVEDNYYSSLLEQMWKEKSDVIICDIFVKYEDIDGLDSRGCACLDANDKHCYVNNGLAASPCNKIFKKELLLKYPFAEGIINEDIPTVIASLISAKKLSYNIDTYYNYMQRNSSVQNATLTDKKLNLFKALDLLEQRIPRNKKNKQFWDEIVFNQIIMFLIYVVPKEKDKKIRKAFLKKFAKLSKKYNLFSNPLWHAFLKEQGKKHQLYYNVFTKTMNANLIGTTNNFISFYHWYSDKFKKSVIKENITMSDLVECAKKQSELKKAKVSISVVIPNYNYEKFLFERLYSILNQEVKLNEVIILDDCSKDNSRELIDKIEKKLKKYIPIKKVYNEQNSGSAFKQWEKGFSLATSDYVWIAEADDYSDSKFLKNVIKPIKKDKDIVVSYVDTAFIDKEGFIFLRSIKKEIDIMKTGHWDSDFVSVGNEEIKNYAFLNCTIANVSSVLFKRSDYAAFFKESGKFKQAGDWLFYLNIMNTGKIAYINKALNYYRVHGSNVTSVTKKAAHFNEIQLVHSYIKKNFGLDKKQEKEIEKRYKFLKKVWGLK